MDDYKNLTGFGVKLKNMKDSISKKGHKEEWLAMYDSLLKGDSPIELEGIFQVTELSILASE